MFPNEPDDPNDRQRPEQREPYPGIGSSLLLMLMGMVASVFTAVALLGLGELAAQGIGRAIGFGAVASLALQRIPPPHGPRLGLRARTPESPGRGKRQQVPQASPISPKRLRKWTNKA